VLNRARRLKPKSKVGRHKYEYKFNKFKRFYQGKEVSVDHIVPVGGLNKPEDLPKFVENLFCHEDNLQVLCKVCHDKKTQEDKENK
jgi:5-methylcytosine-specific restriction endonuclease McrA